MFRHMPPNPVSCPTTKEAPLSKAVIGSLCILQADGDLKGNTNTICIHINENFGEFQANA